nr:MAG TPA: hypothetical protein [Caudoviricetes sp.]
MPLTRLKHIHILSSTFIHFWRPNWMRLMLQPLAVRVSSLPLQPPMPHRGLNQTQTACSAVSRVIRSPEKP